MDAWLVKPGDFVNAGVPVLTITTDKATVELEAFKSGFFHAYLVRAGEAVPIGTPVALMADSMEEPLTQYSARAIAEDSTLPQG